MKPVCGPSSRMVRGAGWRKHDGGAIAIYVALMLPFLVALGVLVVDGGRLFNLDTSLQNNVDALALAGAAELDRRPDSLMRAARAMQNLAHNNELFVGSNPSLSVAFDSSARPTAASDVNWCWLNSIPADNCKIDLSETCTKTSTTAGASCAYDVTSAPENARYIWVKSRAAAADFTMLLPSSFVGGNDGGTPRRTAVAGMSRVVCQPTPLMICNPWEAAGFDTVAELRTKIGSLTVAREYSGGASAISPGQFGLLDPAEVFSSCSNEGNIVSTLTWQLAGAPQASCIAKNGLCPKTGVVASLDNAVNTRFDIYKGSIGSYLNQNAAALVPAARTIWNNPDRSATGCQSTSAHESGGTSTEIWYPREDNWNRVLYFSQYLTQFPGLNSTTALVTLPDGRQKQLGSLTRYETYQWEVAQAATYPSASTPFTYSKPAASTCFAQKANNGTAILNQLGLAGRKSRRDIYVAVANCLEIQQAINNGAEYSFNGSSSKLPLPSLAIAKFFVTEPVNRSYESKINISQSSTSGNSAGAWPQSTCPLRSGFFSFELDTTGNLQAGRTYFLTRPNGLAIDATLSADITPTIADLASAFTASAADMGLSNAYQFCTKTGSNRLFFASTESSNQNTYNFGLSVVDAGKRIMLELVDVFASDNGSDVTRDLVRLYR